MTDQFKKIHPGAMSGMTGPLGGRGSKASPPRKRTRPQKERRKKPRKKDKTRKTLLSESSKRKLSRKAAKVSKSAAKRLVRPARVDTQETMMKKYGLTKAMVKATNKPLQKAINKRQSSREAKKIAAKHKKEINDDETNIRRLVNRVSDELIYKDRPETLKQYREYDRQHTPKKLAKAWEERALKQDLKSQEYKKIARKKIGNKRLHRQLKRDVKQRKN